MNDDDIDALYAARSAAADELEKAVKYLMKHYKKLKRYKKLQKVKRKETMPQAGATQEEMDLDNIYHYAAEWVAVAQMNYRAKFRRLALTTGIWKSDDLFRSIPPHIIGSRPKGDNAA
jgi:hypothetical protein